MTVGSPQMKLMSSTLLLDCYCLPTAILILHGTEKLHAKHILSCSPWRAESWVRGRKLTFLMGGEERACCFSALLVPFLPLLMYTPHQTFLDKIRLVCKDQLKYQLCLKLSDRPRHLTSSTEALGAACFSPVPMCAHTVHSCKLTGTLSFSSQP